MSHSVICDLTDHESKALQKGERGVTVYNSLLTNHGLENGGGFQILAKPAYWTTCLYKLCISAAAGCIHHHSAAQILQNETIRLSSHVL
jgi:hypothetical protein